MASSLQKVLNKKLTSRLFKIAFAILFTLNVVASGYLLEQNHKATTTLNPSYLPKLSYLIYQSIQAVNKPAVIDPTTGQLYLPDAQLVMPAPPENLGQVVYGYTPPGNGQPTEIEIADQNDIRQSSETILTQNNLASILAAVPKAQSCARGVSIYYSTVSGQDLIYKKTLSNNQTLYFYISDSRCQDSAFLSYIKQINSY